MSDNSTVLLSVASIRSVVKRDYGVFIETDIDSKGRPVGIPVAKSYDEIYLKIFNSR